MRDLFTCRLDDVTTEDVLAFLRWESAPGERLPEGVRVDYKRAEDTDKIGDVACAFANTFGGLLVIGVEERDGRPSQLPGVPKARGDLKTRIASTIQSTVHPRPVFEVQTVALPGDDTRELAVLRVAKGDWPPYMFTKDRKNKVSVRVEDESLPATYRDLEGLFLERREPEGETFGTRPPRDPQLRATTLEVDGRTRVASEVFGRLWVRPVRALRLVLDRREEGRFVSLLGRAFPEMGLNVVRRDSMSFDAKIGDGWRQLAWRTCDDGTQGSAANIAALNHPHGQEVYLSLLADRWIRTLKAAGALLEEHGWLGRVAVRSELVLSDARVTAAALERVVIDGVHGVENMPAQRGGFTLDLLAEQADLADPAPLASELLVRHLRELRGLDADMAALTRSLEAVAQTIVFA